MAMLKKNKKQPPVDMHLEVTDNTGTPLLIMPEKQVLRHKLRHKGVIVCLRNLQGQVFLYKRPQQPSMPHSGLWSFAASGRVYAGESFYDAAERRLEEEVAVTGLELTEVARLEPSPQTGNAEAALFMTARCSVLPRIPEPGVQNGMYVDQEELRALLRDFPHMLTPFLHLAAPYLFSNSLR